MPRLAAPDFRCIWSTATGWGTFSLTAGRLILKVDRGTLACRRCAVRGRTAKASVNGKAVAHTVNRQGQVELGGGGLGLPGGVQLHEGDELRLEFAG